MRITALIAISIAVLASVRTSTARDEPEKPAAAPGEAKAKAVRRGTDEPPACTHRHRAEAHTRARRTARPAFRSQPVVPGPMAVPGMPPPMADAFRKMNEAMTRDPARGFQGFADEMSRLEGPALDQIRLSRDEERAVGRKGLAEYLGAAERAGYREVDDAKQLEYLKAIVANLARRMKSRGRYSEIEVHLVDSPIPDGQCLPGGFLVFTTGLLDEPDEATLAGVVAHELAHLDLGHVYQYAKRTKLPEATFTPGVGGAPTFDTFFTRGMAMMGLMMSPYRPEHESEADCKAVTWLYQEGYDPGALVRFFERLHDRQRLERPGPGQAPFIFTMGRSHPFSLDRRDDANRRLAQLQRWRKREDLGLYPDNLRVLRPKAAAEIEGR